MFLAKVLKKTLSVALVVALLCQQSGLVFATTDVSNWSDLQYYVANYSDTYNVTTPLTASSSSGTLNVNSNGRTVIGSSLSENSAGDTLISVGSGVTFTLGNTIYGDIYNRGTLNYSGSYLSSGSISGTGSTLNFTASSVDNYNTITQDNINIGSSTTLNNNAAITANNSFVNNNQINGSGSLTFNGTAVNNGTINQQTGGISNNGNLTNNSTITTKLTNNGDIVGNGNINITGNSDNDGTITQNLVAISNNSIFNNNGMLMAKANNALGSTLNSDPDDLGDNVINDGQLNLNSTGTLSVVVSSTGDTNINADVNNQGRISQNNVNIASGYVLTTNASDVVATTAINNNGIIHYTGGSTANTISGSGRVDITGYVTNTGDITQNNVSNSGIFTNNGTVTANITNTNSIEGTGSITTGTGVSSNTGIITQDALTNNGTFDNTGHIILTSLTNNSTGVFNTNADLLAISNNSIVNNGALNFTGGVNTNDITGTGTTYISGTVENDGNIANNIQVDINGNLGTVTDITSVVENRGILQLVDADITNTGRVKGTGVINILGETTNNSTIEGSTINITTEYGHLTTASDKVSANIVNEALLTWNGGTTNANAISGSGTLEITDGNIVNNATINQGNIYISNGALTSNADLLTVAGGIENDSTFTLTGGVNKNVITGTGDMTITGNVTNKADIEQDTLTNNGNFLNDEGSIVADIVNSGNFINNDGLITGDITNNTSGTFASAGNVISGDITNNGAYIITTGNNANDITGTGNLTFQGETFNTGVINQNNINVDLGATLVASDISDITATNVLSNNGVLELQGGTNNNVIHSTTGTLKITGDVVNTSGKVIVQDNIDIATLGFLTADAGDLSTINGITNSGQLTLDGNGDINSNDISGTGDLVIIGDVNNGGNISQASLTNSGSLTSDASKLAFTDGINNSGTVNFTAGTNENVITNTSGVTTFTNDVVNNAAITQYVVANYTGTLTNNATITADFFNDANAIVENNAAIMGEITNDGIINSVADNLVGPIDNDGTLNIAGGTTQDEIAGTGDTNITGDLVNNYAITQTTVNNSGIMENNAVITAAITNSGTITSTADNLAGTVANDGTLNVTGGTVQDTISGNGELNITGDLVNYDTINQSSVYNEGHLTNNEVITADTIHNIGQIDTAASDLVGDIVNDGKLVFDIPYSVGNSNISGTGDVEITGATVLNGTNTYTGTTLINGGELIIAKQDNLVASDILFANNGLLNVSAATSLGNILKGQAATDDIYVQNDADLTLNTATGEANDFHKTGVGVMTFAMDSNNYTGNTYVDEGTLIGNTLNINNIVNGVAGTTVEFNDTADAELNEINTSGNFVKSASALLNVEANAFTAAQADINSGIFAVNRAITADILNVNSGATLRGNGNITGDVTVASGATIAPGNSIDTLTITGDLDLAAGSTTAIEINETPASDKIIVTGATNIEDGANLTVSNENGRYFEWDSFDILESAGNVTGTFTYDGTIADYDASRIDIELDYSDPTKVVLTAKRKATDYSNNTATGGLSHNQRQAAKAIDNISTGFDGDITNALLQIEELGGLNPQDVTLINPDSTLQTALDDVAGVLYANSALTTLFNAKTAHVYDRIAKRNPSKGACPNCHDNVWVEYYNQYDKVYADANSSHYTNNMSGVLAGYDRSSENLLLGVYGGFGKSDLRQDNGSTMDLDDTTLGIYGGYRTGEWLFKGTMFAGIQHYQAKRAIHFMNRTAKGSYDGMNLGLDLEASYSIPVYNWLTVRPFVGWLNNYSHQNSFTESGAEDLNLHVFGNDQFNSQVRLGVQLEGKLSRLSWYGSAAVKQFVGDDYAKLHMNLSSMPSTDMQIISAELGRTYFSGQAGLTYALTDNWSIFGNLDTGVNNKSANCYGNIGVAFTW